MSPLGGIERGDTVWLLLTVLLALLLPGIFSSGCYDHSRGDPVDRYHYDHTITVVSDHSHVTIQTYINRTHLKVGLKREDLYDGNRDGELTTEGMDRVAITDYVDVEDPSDDAVRRQGELRDYDSIFRGILEAVNSGKNRFTIEDRTYKIRLVSQTLTPLADGALG